MIDNKEAISNSILRNINNYSETQFLYEGEKTFYKCYQNELYRLYKNDLETQIILYFWQSDLVFDESLIECIDISIKYDLCIICFPLELLGTANYLLQQLKNQNLESLPICITVFDSLANINVLKTFKIIPDKLEQRSSSELKSYWCWWRDSSHYEIAQLLELSFKYSYKGNEDIYSKYIYPEFYNLLISGKTKQWDGSTRKKTESESSYKAEKQNYKIPLVQLGLIDTDGYITNKGKELLNIYKTYSEELYFKTISKMILIDGKHLFLIKDLERFQRTNKTIIPKTSKEFFILFEKFMTEKKSLGTRKPTAVTTGAKSSYIRDEPKLWNKLGLFMSENSKNYYTPFEGLNFNFPKILDILVLHI